MLMESQFCSPQNISGASQKNSIAAFFSTTEVAEVKNFQLFQHYPTLQKPRILTRYEKMFFILFFKALSVAT